MDMELEAARVKDTAGPWVVYPGCDRAPSREEGGHPPHGLMLSDSLAIERSAVPRYNPGSQNAFRFVTALDMRRGAFRATIIGAPRFRLNARCSSPGNCENEAGP